MTYDPKSGNNSIMAMVTTKHTFRNIIPQDPAMTKSKRSPKNQAKTLAYYTDVFDTAIKCHYVNQQTDRIPKFNQAKTRNG